MYQIGQLISLMTVKNPRTLLAVVKFKSPARLKELATGMAKRLGVAVVEVPATDAHVAWARKNVDKCRRNLGLSEPAPEVATKSEAATEPAIELAEARRLIGRTKFKSVPDDLALQLGAWLKAQSS